jgi:AcrR family transcriptional regulator
VLDAAQDLLLERPFAELRMEHVAARAGVAKTSLYRRWPSRGALAAAVLADLAAPVLAATDQGDTRAELMEAVMSGIRAVTATRFGGVLIAMLSELAAEPEIGDRFRAEVVAARRASIQALVRRGIERGDLGTSTDLATATELLTAPTYYRLIFGGELDEAFGAAVVDAFMRANRP